jgi:hypothetical protein
VIETTLVAMLEAQAAVTALVDSGEAARIYPEKLPQNGTLPAITYQIVSGPRDYTQDGPDRVVTFRIQLDIYGATAAAAIALRDAIESSISGKHNVRFGSPSVKVQGVFINNERSRYDAQLDVDPAGGPYRKILDLSITIGG